jgi:D-lyxose ketol-isomerase
MSVLRVLYRDSVIKAQKLYYEMILKSGFPIKGLKPEDLEVADFGLSKGELDSFERIGLGIYVLVNQAECGKVLCFLPGQYMPEHRHHSVIVMPRGSEKKEGYLDFKKIVKDFRGLEEYGEDAVYLVPERENLPLPKDGILILGKQEYFHTIMGTGSMFVLGEPTANPTFKIPEDQRQYTKALHEVFLEPGTGYHLGVNTPHSVVAGPNGLMVIEFSTTSRDPLDIFTNPKVERITRIEERPEIK